MLILAHVYSSELCKLRMIYFCVGVANVHSPTLILCFRSARDTKFYALQSVRAEATSHKTLKISNMIYLVNTPGRAV